MRCLTRLDSLVLRYLWIIIVLCSCSNQTPTVEVKRLDCNWGALRLWCWFERLCWSCVGELSAGFGQINGVCSPASACSASSTGRVRPDPPRRSRSQGTRKLHKCLSTASYSEDCGSHSPGPGAFTGQRQQLLVARQYCSFGSTVTRLKINTATSAQQTLSTTYSTLFTIHYNSFSIFST